MILGFLQGLTEFLPLSSSGHLALYQKLSGIAEIQMLFDVMVHLGTLLAVLVVFRSEIIILISDIWRTLIGQTPRDQTSLRLALLLTVGTIPAVVFGFVWKDNVEALFVVPFYIGFAFLFSGSLLWISQFPLRPPRNIAGTTWTDALVIGLGQAVALIPGISRSGTTISIALLMGLDRRLAARYSFLLAIPAILGAVVVQVGGADDIPAEHWAEIATGTFVAAASGYFALKLLLRIVVTGKLSNFSYYCWGMGLLTLGCVFFDLF